jgi:hypothetical protein
LVFEHPLTLFYGWLGKNVTPQVFVFFFGVMELFYFMNLKKKELELGLNNRDCLRKMMMHIKVS